MNLFDSHVATMKAVIIQINVNCFLVKKISKTISSHLKLNKSFCYFRNKYVNILFIYKTTKGFFL